MVSIGQPGAKPESLATSRVARPSQPAPRTSNQLCHLSSPSATRRRNVVYPTVSLVLWQCVLPPRHHAILSSYREKDRDHSDLQAFNAITYGCSNPFIHCTCTLRTKYNTTNFKSTSYTKPAKLHFNQF